MSTTLTSPLLPPEIWFEIISIVAHVIPGISDTTWNYSPDVVIWESQWSRAEMPSSALKQRMSIALVSREWSRMGIQFLYEDVIVGKRANILRLIRLFKQTA